MPKKTLMILTISEFIKYPLKHSKCAHMWRRGIKNYYYLYFQIKAIIKPNTLFLMLVKLLSCF